MTMDATTIDPQVAADLLLKGIESGNWWLIVGPILALTVWVIREKLAPQHPELGDFLKKPLPSLLMPVVVSTLGGLLALLGAGKFGAAAMAALVPSILKVAFTAIASYVSVKKVGEHQEQAKTAAQVLVPALAEAAATLGAPAPVTPPVQPSPDPTPAKPAVEDAPKPPQAP